MRILVVVSFFLLFSFVRLTPLSNETRKNRKVATDQRTRERETGDGERERRNAADGGIA